MADLLLKMPLPYEPKRQNRFILRFPAPMGINEWFVESASRPKISITSKEIEFLNTSTFVSGRFKWEAITIKFRDPIGPSAAQALMEWVRLHAESITGRSGYASGYKQNLTLELLDPTGVVIEKWELIGCIITNADFGALAYNSDSLADISVTIQPDRCILVY